MSVFVAVVLALMAAVLAYTVWMLGRFPRQLRRWPGFIIGLLAVAGIPAIVGAVRHRATDWSPTGAIVLEIFLFACALWLIRRDPQT